MPPDAVTLEQVLAALDFGGDLRDWLRDRKNRPAIKHRFESCGYVPVRNTSRDDGLWVVDDKRQVIYGRKTLGEAMRFTAASALKAAADKAAAERAREAAERAANATEQEKEAAEQAKNMMDGIARARRHPKF